MSAVVQFDDTRACWIIQEDSAPGPAGSATARLGTALIVLDAVEPYRLLEVVLPEWEAGCGLDEADRGLLGTLFGNALTKWLGQAEAGQQYATQLLPSPIWEAVQGLALSVLMQRNRRSGQRLLALDVALHAQRVGDTGIGVVREACWEALPALAALSEMVSRYPDILARLKPAVRAALRERVAVAERVLSADGLAQHSSAGLRLLSALKEALHSEQIVLSDQQVEEQWKGIDARLRDQWSKQTMAHSVPDYTFVATSTPMELAQPTIAAAAKVVPVYLTAPVADVRIRLGHRASVFLDGGHCTAQGRLPGQIVVRVPLHAGAEESDIADMSARLVTREGELLARAELRLRCGEAGLPEAVAKLTCERVDTSSAAVTDSDHMFLDIALDVLPDLDREAILGLTRGRALRAGQRGVAASAAGRSAEAVAQWQEAARLFDLAGAPDLAQQAEHRADVAASAAPAPDWVAQVLDAVDDIARQLLAAGDHVDLDELARVGLELSMLDDETSASLAAIHAQVGRTLSSSAKTTSDDLENESAAHLTEAIRILRSLEDRDSLELARALSREIHRVS